MDFKIQRILCDTNRSVIQYRGTYARWCAMNGISYNEMLVLYTIRECGFCTQKLICDNYLLPRQTIHNVITAMRERGLLRFSKENSSGKEKAFVLTEEGKLAYKTLMVPLARVEEMALKSFGIEKLEQVNALLAEYTLALGSFMEEGQREE